MYGFSVKLIHDVTQNNINIELEDKAVWSTDYSKSTAGL